MEGIVKGLVPEQFVPQAADVVLANILAGPLVELAPLLSSALRSGGSLVLSGILEGQAEEVKNAYSGDFPGLQYESHGWLGVAGGEEKLKGTVKINLGSGHWKLDDWVNVDIDRESQPDVCANLAGGLPFASGVAQLMHTEDFIDQLSLDQAADFLLECHRILAPGGVLRVLTPDMRQLAHLYLHDPEQLKTLWKSFVGVPLSLETAGEVFNLGMRFAGHTFLYR